MASTRLILEICVDCFFDKYPVGPDERDEPVTVDVEEADGPFVCAMCKKEARVLMGVDVLEA